jgi:hypothetical protein
MVQICAQTGHTLKMRATDGFGWSKRTVGNPKRGQSGSGSAANILLGVIAHKPCAIWFAPELCESHFEDSRIGFP